MDPQFETVTSDESSSFRCTALSCLDSALDHTWHYHPEYELTWIVEGRGTRFIGDSVKPYGSGDLVLTGPNLPHCWQALRSGGSLCVSSLVVLQFHPDLFNSAFLGLPEAGCVGALLRRAAGGLHIAGATALAVTSLMTRVVELRGMERLICLLQILTRLAGSSDLTPLASADYHIVNDINEISRKRIEYIHKFVRDNMAQDISQAQVASALRLTAPAFSRFFRQATGMTFMGFVNLTRVNEACRQLEMGDLSVTQIAYRCGYNNISHFNRQFMAVKGMNPTDYRRHMAQFGIRSRAVAA